MTESSPAAACSPPPRLYDQGGPDGGCRTLQRVSKAAMRVQPVAPFQVAHQYPPGQSPKDEHPPSWGKLVSHQCCSIDGVAVVVHSTERRPDGWSYNVVEQRSEPAWVGYYHHKPTGKRVRAANSANALGLAQLLDAL